VVLNADESAEAERVLTALDGFGRVLAVKLYRLTPLRPQPVPILPCLDHEAMLHARIAPHAAAYVQEAPTGDLHEIVCIPAEHRLQIDTVSTWGEHTPESQDRLTSYLAERLPAYRVAVRGPSWWRGERRVASACRAQVSLRDVLLGADTASVKTAIERLATIGALMEKESRVASWGVRTLTAPLLAAAGVVTFWVLGRFTATLGESGVAYLRYLLIGMLGGVFVYFGMKAVQLTEMGNRVWKRTAEYGLILAERKRIAEAPAPRSQ
jgi:hypothetical protein